MWTGTLEFDLLLGDVHSLKQKRGIVRPIIAEVRRRFSVSVAEVDHLDLHRRAMIGAAVVAGSVGQVVAVLDEIERMMAERPEVDLLSTRRSLINSED